MSDVFGVDLEVDTKGMQNGKAALDDLAKSGDKVDNSLSKVDKTLILTKKAADGATVSVDDLAKALDMDSAEFDSTQKRIVNSLNQTAQQMNTASTAVDRFEQDQKMLGYTITSSGKVLDKQGVEVLKLSRRWEDLNKRLVISKAKFDTAKASAVSLGDAALATGKKFSFAKGASTQLGYQLQDIAVQAQMGVKPMTILGQQGSQLAMVLGPQGALIGAVIAISAALGGTLMAAFGKVKAEATEVKDKILAMTDSFDDLTRAQKEALKIAFTEDITKQKKELNTTIKAINQNEKEIANLTKSIKFYKSQITDLTPEFSNERFRNAIQNATIKIKELEKANKVLAGEWDTAFRSMAGVTEDLGEVTKQTIDLISSDLLTSIKNQTQLESLKWNEIQKGRREYEAQLKTMQMIDDSAKSILFSEEAAKEAAIAKGRAQEEVLKNQRLSAAESAIDSAIQSGKTEVEIEKEAYQERLELLREYADEKGWLESKLRENEILFAEEHQAKLLEIEKSGTTARVENTSDMYDEIAQGVSIFNDLTTAIDAKQRAQLERDLANKENFSEAEIALKEKTAKALFDKQKEADKASIMTNTLVAGMYQLRTGNWLGAAAVGVAGAKAWAQADATEYGGSTAPTSGGYSEPPPSVQNNNNTESNNYSFTFEGGNNTGLTKDELIDLFKQGFIAFDGNTEQGSLLK